MSLNFGDIKIRDLVCLLYVHNRQQRRRIVEITWHGETQLGYELRAIQENGKFISIDTARRRGIDVRSKRILTSASWDNNLGRGSYLCDSKGRRI